MTQIDSVSIEGLCGLRERVDLQPVSVFLGPNGSGKSTIVSAVAYALTGRFPRVGVNADTLQPLASDAEGFTVTLEARTATGTSIVVERGLKKDKRKLAVTVDGRTIRAVRDAEAILRNHFGDVDWFVDMFDPERSFWRMSPEKQSRWMFELCAGASGWTKERAVAQIVGHVKDGITPDWNVRLGRDAASNVEINLQQLEERLLAAQRVVRESTSIAEGIAPPSVAPTEEDLRAAEEELRLATEDAERKRIAKAEHNAACEKLDAKIEALDAELLQAEILTGMTPEQCPLCGHTLDHAGVKLVERERIRKAEGIVAMLKEFRASREADAAPQLAGQLDAAVARYSAAAEGVSTLRQREGVARERAGQLAAAEGAVKRVGELKTLIESAHVVRRAMLRDSIEPLRKALGELDHLAPGGWTWSVGSDGFGMKRPWINGGDEIVTVGAMSAGEKYRASIALLVATSMLRREPWVGLFLDAFEQVSDDVRTDVLAALVKAQEAGHVDNVFVAGAFGLPQRLHGAVAYHERARRTS